MKTIVSLALILIFGSGLALPPAQTLSADAYLYQKQVVTPVSPPQAALAQLNQLVETIISQPERFHPYHQDIGIMDSYLFMGYPGEEFLALCDALPFIDASRQAAVISYIRNGMNTYPPHTYPHFPDNWGIISSAAGNRREYAALQQWEINIWPPVEVPLGSLYVTWKCADSTDNMAYISQHWSDLRTVFADFVDSSQPISTYQELLGVIGFVRLAHYMNQNGADESALIATATQMVEQAIPRLSDIQNTILYGKTLFETENSHDWTLPLFHASRTNRAVVALYGPELGRLMQAEAGPQIKAIFDGLFSYMPAWFMTRGFYPTVGSADASGSLIWDGQELNWFLGSGYSENNMLTPDIVWTLFMVRAAVYAEPADVLVQLADVPFTARGDTYHIQKLSAALKQASQICWQDIRDHTTSCDPAPPA